MSGINYKLKFANKSYESDELIILGSFCKSEGKKKILNNSTWPAEFKDSFNSHKYSSEFTGEKDSSYTFFSQDGIKVIAYGLGDKKELNEESLRKSSATLFKSISKKYKTISFDLDSFTIKNNEEKSFSIIQEAFALTDYNFDKYKSTKENLKLKTIIFETKLPKTKMQKFKTIQDELLCIADAIHFSRDLVNDPPNVLNSETYAKRIEKDVKSFKGVKVKILDKADLKKEKMGLFLSVNAGSAYGPRLVHLTYTPSKATSKTKHIALVGKGLTFDTGGYSLKPAASIINMKFDMAGSATVYGAFRALVQQSPKVKISCFLGITDNAVSGLATMPDSICTGRNGKTVEILNTDAEGRLVLADVLDYACDQKPDVVIDVATLTGACLIALGNEVCGLMSNSDKLANELQKSAKEVDEYIWQLPIIPEWAKDMKSNIADLKNIGGSRNAGTAKAAAFLQEFIKNDVQWAHLDIAGVGDSQSHLPYCPAKGASGLMIRTLYRYVQNGKY
ncbi:MAG: leucyl aminopeptidase [Halobacteriovoraceae bacterium]|nr:leucyl aminopeptidase [Halobacteriovoraceae bacterium]